MVLRTSGTIVDLGQPLGSRFGDIESAASRNRSVSNHRGCGPILAGSALLASASRCRF
jgi:hypothetical protein